MTKLKEAHVIDLSEENLAKGLSASNQLRLVALFKSANEKQTSHWAADQLYAVTYLNASNRLTTENIKLTCAVDVKHCQHQPMEPLHQVQSNDNSLAPNKTRYLRIRGDSIDVLRQANLSTAYAASNAPIQSDIDTQPFITPTIKVLDDHIQLLQKKKKNFMNKLFGRSLNEQINTGSIYYHALLNADVSNPAKLLLVYCMLRSEHDETLSNSIFFDFRIDDEESMLANTRETLMTHFNVADGRDAEFDRLVDEVQVRIEQNHEDPFHGTDVVDRLAQLSEPNDMRLEVGWINLKEGPQK